MDARGTKLTCYCRLIAHCCEISACVRSGHVLQACEVIIFRQYNPQQEVAAFLPRGHHATGEVYFETVCHQHAPLTWSHIERAGAMGGSQLSQELSQDRLLDH